MNNTIIIICTRAGAYERCEAARWSALLLESRFSYNHLPYMASHLAGAKWHAVVGVRGYVINTACA